MKGKKTDDGKTLKKGKVVVAMSGGVDSSVTAALLVRQGYECIGMHLHIWHDPVAIPQEERDKFPQKQCCTLEALEGARRTCQRLGIPFYVLNVADEFKKRIVDYFIETYAEGKTPNPCIECNRQIRFGILLQHARSLGADFIATGHYIQRKEVQKDNGTFYELLRAKDPFKDQSYFLYTLTQSVLKSVFFPLGDYMKKEVRVLAADFGLEEVRDAPESQNICFFPDKKYQDFLKRHAPKKSLTPGPIKTMDGKQIGTHEGFALYTIGQRQGLKLGGQSEPLYVIALDKKENTVIVGPKVHLESQEVVLSELTFVADEPPKLPTEISLKVRHPGKLERATFVSIQNGRAIMKFLKPVEALSPGQSMVFYDGEKMLGGGIIN